MDRKTYSIYRITGPSGRSYIGLTSQPVFERWRQHLQRVGKKQKHPLYDAIAKYGKDSFSIEVLEQGLCLNGAKEAEIRYIAELENPYNLSPGGEDTEYASLRFRELLKDPEWKTEYGKKLSEAVRSSEAHQAHVNTLSARAKKWREDNPKEAYYVARRSLRIANRGNPKKEPENQRLTFDTKGPSRKKRRSMSAAKRAKAIWLNMPEETKEVKKERISKSVKALHENMTDADRQAHLERLARARKNIDHDLRKKRQKEALASYWTPERRAKKAETMREWNRKKREESVEDV